jgi:redox-sensitive bicupin YhaK (pirin superfamily)
VVELADGAGRARIIAGNFAGTRGAARTFSPVNVWDLRLNGGRDLALDLPQGHTAMIAVLSGQVTINGSQPVGEAQIVRFAREGTQVAVHADADAMLLVLTGQPLGEPVFGYGPFVMTSEAEIRQAITDFNSGKFGQTT